MLIIKSLVIRQWKIYLYLLYQNEAGHVYRREEVLLSTLWMHPVGIH